MQFTQEMARGADRLAAQSLDTKPNAASRRKAAEALGLPYKAFLAVWKGEEVAAA